jgi:hypothetical protein
MRVVPNQFWGYRVDGADGAVETHDRGICVNCGAHAPCRIGLATVAGICSVCGSGGIEPIEAAPTRPPLALVRRT